MLQLHTSQLECQSLKSDDEEGEIADMIRMKLVRKREREKGLYEEEDFDLGRTNDQTTGRI